MPLSITKRRVFSAGAEISPTVQAGRFPRPSRKLLRGAQNCGRRARTFVLPVFGRGHADENAQSFSCRSTGKTPQVPIDKAGARTISAPLPYQQHLAAFYSLDVDILRPKAAAGATVCAAAAVAASGIRTAHTAAAGFEISANRTDAEKHSKRDKCKNNDICKIHNCPPFFLFTGQVPRKRIFPPPFA